MIQELVFHAVLLVFMAVLFWESRSFPEMNIGGQLGAAWWPQLTLGLGMVLTVASAAFVVRKSIRDAGGAASVKLKELKSLGISGGIFCAFLLVMEVVGFMGAMPVLMFGFMYQLGARKPSMLVLVPILSSPLFAFIFGRFMEVSLPRGIGWIRILSFYVY
ncbi:MAG: tripartite tricarboxylate transporter TctB family protein [Rhodospirillales bacterium]|jgi:hypothetical protein|nr:tripartite tricarboxylate transporter TctB family protein [Rhodospirillales bacterium]